MAPEPPERSEAIGSPRPPPALGAGDVSPEASPHIMAILFEMSGKIGEISNAVQTLNQTVRDHGGKIDALNKKIWIAVGALGISLPAAAFIIGKAWDQFFS